MDQAVAQDVDGVVDGTDAMTDDAGSGRLSLAFSTWHRLLRTLLVVHVPLLAVFAYFRDIDTVLALALLAVPLLMVVASSSVGSERFRASLIAIGFSWCSWLLIVWSGGAIEAHFHGLIVIGLVGLYRDWVALAITTVAQIVLHLAIGPFDPSLIYNHEAAIASPLTWGFVQICAILGAAAVPVFSWRGTREAEDNSAARATEVVREAAEGQRQRAVAAVYATVARRSQTLLERQLDLIEKLEQDEKDPETLQDLFSLDHLATRMNREAASMLVLAGGEPNRRVVGRPPLSEVTRGAIGEIEDYTRVDLELSDDRTVEGRVVAPLVHLLSELIENAASYSPPDSRVTVTGASASDGSFLLRIADRGIGIDPDKLAQYNHLLTNPRSTSFTDSQRLGLDVVARLAGRYSLPVQLANNPEGRGTVATVLVPAALLSAPEERVLATAQPAAEMPMPSAPEDLLEEVPADGKSETALPAMEPAPPVPVDATAPAAAPPAAPQGVPAGAPSWAQATARASSGDPQSASAARTAAPAADAPAAPPVQPPARRPGSGLSWSYSGHLTGEEPAPAEPKPKPKRRGMFGRRARTEAVPPAAAGTPSAPEAPSAPSADENPIQAPDDLDALLNATRARPQAGAPSTPPDAQPAAPTPAQPTPAQPTPAKPTPAEPTPAQASSPQGSAPPGTPASSGAGGPSATPEQDADPEPAQSAAAALLDDLPGMGSSAPQSPQRPRPSTPPVAMPQQGGRGPAVPPQRPSGGARPAVGQPSSPADPGRKAPRPTVGTGPARGPAQSGTAAPDSPQPAAASAKPPEQGPRPTGDGPSEAARPQTPAPSAGSQLPTRQPPGGASSGPTTPTAPSVGGGDDVTPAPVPERPSGSGDEPTSEIGTPLPKRRRGAALPSTLRNPDEGPKPAAAAAAPVSREQSRNLLSSFQSRLQAGRKAAEEQVSNPDETSDSDTDGPGEDT